VPHLVARRDHRSLVAAAALAKRDHERALREGRKAQLKAGYQQRQFDEAESWPVQRKPKSRQS